MFTLDGKHTFESDEEWCWISVTSGYGQDASSDEHGDFSWALHLQSQSTLTRFPIESVQSSFGIEVYPPLGISNWTDLPWRGVQIPRESLRCGFMFHYDMSKQWEDLISLHLRFGAIKGTRIEVFADGKGSVEAATDVFPSGVVQFQVRAWALFRGVSINVPLNVGDPLSYSTARIKALLPTYAFLPPLLRRTCDDSGTVRAVEAWFRPEEPLPQT